MRIAVLGLGRMGAPMARNLIEVGHNVTLYNRTRTKALELASTGARVASTVADAIREAQVALTMLADDAAEEELTFGLDGLLAHLPAGAIHLCMSSIGVECSRRLAAAHGEKGQGYVAAPVFGRPGAAASRHLWIVAAGPEAQVTRCLSLFDALARGLTRVGEVPELAHALKLGGNMLTLSLVEGLSEILAFGEKAGLPPAEYLRLLNTAIFKSPLLDAYGGLMVRHTYEPADLSLEGAARDMGLALQASEGMAIRLPMAQLLQARLELAMGKGFGTQDLSVLSKACRMEAGLEVGSPVPPVAAPPEARAKGAEKPKQEPALEWAAPSAKISASEKEIIPEKVPVPEKEAIAAKAPVPEAPPIPQPPLPPPQPEPPPPLQYDPRFSFPATEGERQLILDLKRISHFEAVKDMVWAWSQGKRYGTPWRNLVEVELAFRHTLLLRIQRHMLLQPESVQSIKPLFGGRARIKVGENLELEANRASSARLKEVLGL